jgi:hypothetical protein
MNLRKVKPKTITVSPAGAWARTAFSHTHYSMNDKLAHVDSVVLNKSRNPLF